MFKRTVKPYHPNNYINCNLINVILHVNNNNNKKILTIISMIFFIIKTFKDLV